MSVAAEAMPASSMPSSLKRPHPDADTAVDPATPNESRQSSPTPASTALSSPADIATPKDTPMAASTNPTSTSTSPSKAATQSHATPQSSSITKLTPQSSSAPPAKRRRLTPAEKAEQEAAKAKKAQDRAEAAARKEAERAAKDEEKRKKAEEKELKKKQKEEEKQLKEKLKEEEKRAKEEEKKAKEEKKEAEKKKKADEKEAERALKDFKKQEKEREAKQREASQMRLSSFFSIPKTSSPAAPVPSKLKASASPSKNGFMTKDEARRRSMSLDPVDFDPPSPTKSKPTSNDDTQAKKDKGFLPFVLGKNMRLAPHNAFLPAREELVRVNEAMDKFASQPSEKPSPSLMESFANVKVQRGFQPPKVSQVISKLQGSSSAPIDFTGESADKPMNVLKSIPVKYFFYGEDVRPPYRGTWTRPVDSRLARRLACQPLTQQLPEVVYDYDSEAEWDDAEEGEDIELEDNEEEEEEEEEMEGFIDDDNAPQYLAKRGLPANDVQPICSGLQWEDADGKMRAADPSYADANFKDFEICFLLDPSPETIDPFTTAYWDPEPKQVSSQLPLTSSMGPPRLPLSDRTNGQANVQSTLVNGKVPKAAKVGPRLVPADVLPAFTQAIDGSDLTKIALIEHLKKTFPKLNKAQITETLPVVAQRVGAKQAEKKWVLLSDAKV